jgi:hypothetical protein
MSVIYGQIKIETIPAVIYMRHVLLAKLREREILWINYFTLK